MKRSIADLYNDMFYEMTMNGIYDDNDDYLDEEYFYDKWKEESEEYFDNLDNINLENEVWKDIPNYEGLYQVSNLGNVKSLKYGKERILKPIKNSDGYLFFNLYKNKKHKTYLVHRLVATVFLPNPDSLKEINHKDENSLNNMVENLEWCDRKYNINYGSRNQKMLETRRINDPNNESYQRMISTRRINNPNNECYKKMIETRTKNGSNNAEKPVIQYTKDGIKINIYKSTIEAERQTGIPQSNICRCCKGKLKSCGGFIWEYL